MPARAPTWAEFAAAFELFSDAIRCGAIGGAALGFLGVYVVLRRMVFVSAAVTQSAGLGVALSFYGEIHLGLHVDPLYGAAALALLATLLFVVEPRRLHLTRESLLGVAFALAGGLAVLVGARITQEAHDIQAILFGTAVLVRPSDRFAVEAAAVAILALHLWWFRGLTFASFDPVGARVQGLPVGLLDAIVLLSIGLMVGVTARALGSLPVFAFSTLPAIAALLLGMSLRLTFALATIFGGVAGVAGYLLAFFRELPVGASQTVVAGAFAVAASLLRIGGLTARAATRRG